MITLSDDLLDAIADRVADRVLAKLKPAEPAGLVTKTQLAKALGCCTVTIDRYLTQGRIPFQAVGKRRKFDVAEVRKALNT